MFCLAFLISSSFCSKSLTLAYLFESGGRVVWELFARISIAGTGQDAYGRETRD